MDDSDIVSYMNNILNHLNEKKTIVKYSHNLYEIDCNCSLDMVQSSEENIDISEKNIYTPYCDFDITINLLDKSNYTIIINNSKINKINDEQLLQCYNMFDRLHQNSIPNIYNIVYEFNFNNTEETDYIYNIIENMLSVFCPDNRKLSLEILYNRCDLSYNVKSSTFDRRNTFDMEVSKIIEINKDISLIYIMHHFINYLSDVEYLVAIYHFNKYGLYNCDISKDDIDEYLKSGDLTAELVYLIDDFKNHLFEIYRNHLKDIQDVYNKKKDFLREMMHK